MITVEVTGVKDGFTTTTSSSEAISVKPHPHSWRPVLEWWLQILEAWGTRVVT